MFKISNMQRLIDFTLVILCWYIAYLLRFYYLPNAQYGLGELFFKISPILGILTLYFAGKNGLYKSQRFNSRYKEILSVFKANTTAVLSFVIVLYFFADNRLSRGTILIYFGISSFVLTITRIVVRNMLRSIRSKGKNLRHILLVGNGAQLGNYIDMVRDYKDSGINFLGWIDSDGLNEQYEINALTQNLDEAKKELKPDAIVLCYTSKDSEKLDIILKEHHNDITPLQILPDLSYSLIGHEIEEFAGIPVLTVNQPKLSTIGLFFKRLFDFMATLAGVIIISPLLILLAALVKLSSRGPIFYSQERMGLDGQNFKMWKFRTMKHDPEAKPGWTVENDPRRTRLGTFLRKSSLDELPQLFNVLLGQMSLVGPRPEQPHFVEKFRNEIPGYMLRHKMRAGITGWAQINGWRGDTSLHKRIECDIFYIKNWNFFLDIKILFLTFWKGFFNKNAY